MNQRYQDQLDQMVWSYSRIKSYENCPACFKMTYLDKCSKVNNAFAEWGSLGHHLFELYIKGELAEFEMGDAYEEQYGEFVKHSFPPTRGRPLDEKYYETGFEFFSSFNGFPPEWELIDAEMKAEFKIEDFPFIGYLDMLVKDKRDGKLIVVDHKSKAGFKNEKEKQEYAIQLYLYSDWVKLKYGEYPKALVFNMFREGEFVEIPFSLVEFQNAIQWAVDQIHRIYEDFDFWDKIYLSYEAKGKDLSTYKQNDFFCKYLCGCREHCERSGEQELL